MNRRLLMYRMRARRAAVRARSRWCGLTGHRWLDGDDDGELFVLPPFCLRCGVFK